MEDTNQFKTALAHSGAPLETLVKLKISSNIKVSERTTDPATGKLGPQTWTCTVPDYPGVWGMTITEYSGDVLLTDFDYHSTYKWLAAGTMTGANTKMRGTGTHTTPYLVRLDDNCKNFLSSN